MSRRVSTAGMYLAWAVEATAGTRPETGYTKVSEIRSMPSLNSAPPSIDSTTLAETEYKTAVPDLKELGVLDYSANLTDGLIDEWKAVRTAFESASLEGKQLWFAHVHPKLKEAVFYPGEPAPLEWDGASVSAMASTTLYVTAVGPVESGDKPTLSGV